MSQLSHKVAIIAGHYVEENELFRAIRQLRASEVEFDLLTPPSLVNPSGSLSSLRWSPLFFQGGELELGDSFRVTRYLSEMTQTSDYTALILPGGILSVTLLRESPESLRFIQDFAHTERPILWMGFSSLLGISTQILEGRTLTANRTIRHELRNAGALWLDQECVIDQNWVSTRDEESIASGITHFFELLTYPEALIPPSSRTLFSKAKVS